MAVDPLCNMEVEEQGVEHRSEYLGKILYFCCEQCKRWFESET
jgi:YHS domain-containing protein